MRPRFDNAGSPPDTGMPGPGAAPGGPGGAAGQARRMGVNLRSDYEARPRRDPEVTAAEEQPIVSIVVFETLVLICTIFHHSNVALPPGLERALSRLVVTPSIHWVHHHRIRRDTDANYSTLLSLWDRLFASRSPTPRMLGMPIGVEGREELALPQLLIAPFRRAGR